MTNPTLPIPPIFALVVGDAGGHKSPYDTARLWVDDAGYLYGASNCWVVRQTFDAPPRIVNIVRSSSMEPDEADEDMGRSVRCVPPIEGVVLAALNGIGFTEAIGWPSAVMTQHARCPTCDGRANIPGQYVQTCFLCLGVGRYRDSNSVSWWRTRDDGRPLCSASTRRLQFATPMLQTGWSVALCVHKSNRDDVGTLGEAGRHASARTCLRFEFTKAGHRTVQAVLAQTVQCDRDGFPWFGANVDLDGHLLASDVDAD